MLETLSIAALAAALTIAAIVLTPFFWAPAAGPATVLARKAWQHRRNASR